jgi:hypothetical protein
MGSEITPHSERCREADLSREAFAHAGGRFDGRSADEHALVVEEPCRTALGCEDRAILAGFPERMAGNW